MEIISAIIVGGVVGALAKLLMPGKDPGGVMVTVAVGIAGAVTAGFVGRLIGWYRPGLSVPGMLASVLGAMILLGGFRVFARSRGLV